MLHGKLVMKLAVWEVKASLGDEMNETGEAKGIHNSSSCISHWFHSQQTYSLQKTINYYQITILPSV